MPRASISFWYNCCLYALYSNRVSSIHRIARTFAHVIWKWQSWCMYVCYTCTYFSCFVDCYFCLFVWYTTFLRIYALYLFGKITSNAVSSVNAYSGDVVDNNYYYYYNYYYYLYCYHYKYYYEDDGDEVAVSKVDCLLALLWLHLLLLLLLFVWVNECLVVILSS